VARLVAEGDVTGLTKIKGVGKKTAERLVLELREKCELLLLSWKASGAGPVLRPSAAPAGARRARPPLIDEVATALVQMGWRPAEADKAVADLVVDDGATLESLLRLALRAMPR
jgi:Holliday junction DNA helicase RuvA